MTRAGLVASLLLLAAVHGVQGNCFDCLKVFGEGRVGCLECIDSMSVLQLPYTYVTGMLTLRDGYTNAFCPRAENAVPLAEYPSGWKQQEDGTFTGCEKAENFPGIRTTSHQSHEYVKKVLKQFPEMQNNGSVWRGSELGYLFVPNLYYEGLVEPQAIGLGATAEQHKVVRPVLDRVLGHCDQECRNSLEASAADFLASRGDRFEVRAEVTQWVFRELFKRTFPEEEKPWPTFFEDLAELQGSYTQNMVLSQFVPDWVAKTFVARSTIAGLRRFNEGLRQMVQKHYGADLEGKDCSPSPDCLSQLTAGIVDFMLAAGGLSVPSGIHTAAFVLYGDVAAHGDTFPKGYRVEKPEAANFFWESLRFFPPVVGFPYWTTLPEVATRNGGNQYTPGVREILNVAMANRDPNAWGPDAHKFRVRSTSEYAKHFIGFADFAEDNTVANGAMNRFCPAKKLAVAMGAAFYSVFDQDAWVVADDVEVPTWSDVTPFTTDVVLQRIPLEARQARFAEKAAALNAKRQ